MSTPRNNLIRLYRRQGYEHVGPNNSAVIAGPEAEADVSYNVLSADLRNVSRFRLFRHEMRRKCVASHDGTIERGCVIPLLSTTLLFEYEEILNRHQRVLGLTNRAIEDVLDGLCARG